MVLILNDDERIALRVLIGHVPGRRRGSGAPAEPQARALAQGIQSETSMLAQERAAIVLYGPRFGVQVSAEEFLKGPLTDETDARAVRFVVHRQSGRMRQLA